MGNEMKEVNEVYSRIRVPGACGFMVGTPVKWLSCLISSTISFKEKEHFPFVAHMVIVDHNMKIMHCSSSIWGAENDIGVCNNDLVVKDIINGKLQNIEFNLYNMYGQPMKIIYLPRSIQRLPQL